MRSLITLILLCFLTSYRLLAQTTTAPTVTTVDGKARIEFIVPALGEQDALFLKGKDWLYKTYNSGKTVEQYDDKAAGRIAVKARTQELKWNAGLGIVNTAGCFTYNMTLDFKEGKSRLIIEDITYQKGQLKDAMILASGADLADTFPANWPTLGKKAMTKHWNEMQAAGTSELLLLATSFQSALTKKGDNKDW
ncbi:hypothetical protein GCM10027511_32340 [Hymenobacter humi]